MDWELAARLAIAFAALFYLWVFGSIIRTVVIRRWQKRAMRNQIWASDPPSA